MFRITAAAAAVVAMTLATAASSQQPIAYPAKGQTPQQQQQDTGECQVWAKQNTGVDPVAVAQQASNAPPPPQPQGERARGVVRGAVVGGVIGGIGGRGGEGAAAGAVVGGLSGRREQQAKQEQYAQQQQYMQQQAQSQIATYNRAFAACMGGRGYSIQ